MNDDETSLDRYNDDGNLGLSIPKRIKDKMQNILDEEMAREKRTWSHYEKIRKNNPTLYWREATQRQLHKDLQELQGDFGR